MEKPRSRGVIRVTNTHTLSLSLCVCVWIHPKNWGDKNSEVCSAMTQLNIGNKGCENLRVNKNLCQWFFSGLSSLSLSLTFTLSFSLSITLSFSLSHRKFWFFWLWIPWTHLRRYLDELYGSEDDALAVSQQWVSTEVKREEELISDQIRENIF